MYVQRQKYTGTPVSMRFDPLSAPVDTTVYSKVCLKVAMAVVALLLTLRFADYLVISGSRDAALGSELLWQGMRWHAMSQQDKHPLFALQHANYAVAYVNSARSACRDANLERLTKIDITATARKVLEHQRQAAKTLSQWGPKVKEGRELGHSGWLDA